MGHQPCAGDVEEREAKRRPSEHRKHTSDWTRGARDRGDGGHADHDQQPDGHRDSAGHIQCLRFRQGVEDVTRG